MTVDRIADDGDNETDDPATVRDALRTAILVAGGRPEDHADTVVDALTEYTDEIEGAKIMLDSRRAVWVHTTAQVNQWLEAILDGRI